MNDSRMNDLLKKIFQNKNNPEKPKERPSERQSVIDIAHNKANGNPRICANIRGMLLLGEAFCENQAAALAKYSTAIINTSGSDHQKRRETLTANFIIGDLIPTFLEKIDYQEYESTINQLKGIELSHEKAGEFINTNLASLFYSVKSKAEALGAGGFHWGTNANQNITELTLMIYKVYSKTNPTNPLEGMVFKKVDRLVGDLLKAGETIH